MTRQHAARRRPMSFVAVDIEGTDLL